MQERIFPHLAELARAFAFEGPQDRAHFLAALLSMATPPPRENLPPPPPFYVQGGPATGKTTVSGVLGLLYQGSLPEHFVASSLSLGVDVWGETTSREIKDLFREVSFPLVTLESGSLNASRTLQAEIIRASLVRVIEEGGDLGRYPSRPLFVIELPPGPEADVDDWGLLIRLGEGNPPWPVVDTITYVDTNRAQLLADIRRAWRLWDEAGQPQAPGRWASHPFELWAGDVGGVVTKILGEEGFLAG